MTDPPSPTRRRVVGADEQDTVAIDVARWSALAETVLLDEQRVGELTLTFVDRHEMAALNAEHMGADGPTDVLSFPLDDDRSPAPAAVPVLLGDVVVCPEIALAQAPEHAGTVDDELALLVVHGVLHVLGHDHVGDADTASMRARECELLEAHHWGGPAPAGFRQEHS